MPEDLFPAADPTREGFDPDTPIAGHYRMRLRSGGVFVAVRLWHGAPIEPWTGETMDRAPRWNATINGKWCEVERVWPRCAADPIDIAEYDHLCGLQAWAAENAPNSAFADPRRKLDMLSAPLPF